MSSRRQSAEAKTKSSRRHTRGSFSAEDKIRIVLEGIQGDTNIEELCNREGISQTLYSNWSKDFIEAGKSKLSGELKNEAVTNEVQKLKKENIDLKQLVAELTLEVRMIKSSMNGSV